MASIVFTDADGTWKLHNGKPYPASRFQGWTPDSTPFGDSVPRLSDGALTMFRFRVDYRVAFDLHHIPSNAATNLLTKAEELDNGAWTKSACTISANAGRGPHGDLVGDKIQEDNTNAAHVVFRDVAGLTNSTVYMFSVSIAPSERQWVFLQIIGKDAAANSAYFNLLTGATGTTAGTIVSSGTSAWYGGPTGLWMRCWLSASVATGGGTPSIYIVPATANGTSSYLGTTGSGLYATGAMLEANTGNFPSPYVYTGAAAVTTVSQLEIADRLKYHLLNAGTCAVYTHDYAGSSYATCGLAPGTTPQITLTDRRTMEFTLSVQLLNTAASPARMLARYGEG